MNDLFTDEALEATDQADAALEALDEIGDFIVDNWDEIAEGETSTEPLWEGYHEQFERTEEPALPDPLADLETPYEPEPPEPDLGPVPEPEPGDLDWEPSETGVRYPDPERMEGNVGGPEVLG